MVDTGLQIAICEFRRGRIERVALSELMGGCVSVRMRVSDYRHIENPFRLGEACIREEGPSSLAAAIIA